MAYGSMSVGRYKTSTFSGAKQDIVCHLLHVTVQSISGSAEKIKYLSGCIRFDLSKIDDYGLLAFKLSTSLGHSSNPGSMTIILN